ncbi:MAG: lamin tail domain-containing protein [Prevotellaceae bacterium]|jgi:hypothetical protein|nr:lamin tail domain-containing protein [Prevotellaceae bacterium]
MKRLVLFFLLGISISAFSQFTDDFSDGDFTGNPTWSGTTSNFIVNAEMQLQSNASATSTSYLTTESEAIKNAAWECWVKITYNPSNSNYASFYLVSSNSDLTNTNAYYVQIGNSADEISLYKQTGTIKTKIIDGTDKRIDTNPVEVNIKVTRDENGKWSLFSKLATESDFVQEGNDTIETTHQFSYYAGVLFSNSGTTGKNYYFDNINISGEKYPDSTPPNVSSTVITDVNKLLITFSEKVDISAANFSFPNELGSFTSTLLADNRQLEIIFENEFVTRTVYPFTLNNIFDLNGNALEKTNYQFGVSESAEAGDLIINEVMPNSADGSEDYIEIYNKSDKIIDLTGVKFIKTSVADLAIQEIPTGTIIFPQNYLAFVAHPEALREFFSVPEEANIASINLGTFLTNETASIQLSDGIIVFDELSYSDKWHDPLIKNPKGVALERIDPHQPTQDASNWHSAASDVNYGTPGYKNSQYRDKSVQGSSSKEVWIEKETFSPNNDGYEDILLINYLLPDNGWMADITIFDASGHKVRKLYDSFLLGTEGTLSWDGSDSNHRTANIGIHVLFVELYNASLGKTKQFKLVCVVSGKK